MIVWLGSYPRSGNTFVRQILATCGGVKTYSIYGNGVLSKGKIAKAIGYAELPDLSTAINSSKLFFIKTHSSPDVDMDVAKFPAIYIVRDGRDAIVSHAHYLARKSSPYGKMLRELVRGKSTLRRPWVTHVLVWHGRKAPTAYVWYEDLLAAPFMVMREALRRLDIRLKLTDTELVPFSELHDAKPKFFRKGIVGSWKEEMPNDIHTLFWEVHGEGMQTYGYENQAPKETTTGKDHEQIESVGSKEGYDKEVRIRARTNRHIRRGGKRRKSH